jgi:hypothetical protein
MCIPHMSPPRHELAAHASGVPPFGHATYSAVSFINSIPFAKLPDVGLKRSCFHSLGHSLQEGMQSIVKKHSHVLYHVGPVMPKTLVRPARFITGSVGDSTRDSTALSSTYGLPSYSTADHCLIALPAELFLQYRATCTRRPNFSGPSHRPTCAPWHVLDRSNGQSGPLSISQRRFTAGGTLRCPHGEVPASKVAATFNSGHRSNSRTSVLIL